MKVAIIGSGISGLTVADAIHRTHDITVFEAADYIGGHTNTIDVQLGGQRFAVDTGFIVFNDRTYPNFIRMLDRLGVASQPAPMTFSLRCDQTNLEYRGADIGGLFAQRGNLFRPGFYRLLADIVRFNRQATGLLDDPDDDQTVREFFSDHRYSRIFYDKYFLPMGSAIWSCPRSCFEEFPIRFIAEFYHHHGMLSINDRPQWRVICGGSRSYVEPLAAPFRDRVRLSCPVQRVHRTGEQVMVESQDYGGNPHAEPFDHVVFACHSDQALRMLGNTATDVEREVLEAFPYESNEAILHTDVSVLPRRKRAWAAWNYHIPMGASQKATLTYNMNQLQSLRSDHTFCVTLNAVDQINPARIIRSLDYAHPIFDARRRRMQRRHHELIGVHRSSFCGAYWGNGFHEDGVVSGLAVANHLINWRNHEQLHLRRPRAASKV